jgi:hypothetical protein
MELGNGDGSVAAAVGTRPSAVVEAKLADGINPA